MAFALIQQGGTRYELYLHVHPTAEDAVQDRRSCATDGAYATTEPVEMPDDTDWDAVETLIQSLDTLEILEEER